MPAFLTRPPVYAALTLIGVQFFTGMLADLAVGAVLVGIVAVLSSKD